MFEVWYNILVSNGVSQLLRPYKASISNHLNIRGTANLEAFLFNTMFYRNQKTEDNERG